MMKNSFIEKTVSAYYGSLLQKLAALDENAREKKRVCEGERYKEERQLVLKLSFTGRIEY